MSKGWAIGRGVLTEGEMVTLLMQGIAGSVMYLMIPEDEVALVGWHLFLATFLAHDIMSIRRSLKFAHRKRKFSNVLPANQFVEWSARFHKSIATVQKEELEAYKLRLNTEIVRHRCLAVLLTIWVAVQFVFLQFLLTPRTFHASLFRTLILQINDMIFTVGLFGIFSIRRKSEQYRVHPLRFNSVSVDLFLKIFRAQNI